MELPGHVRSAMELRNESFKDGMDGNCLDIVAGGVESGEF